MKNKSLKEYLQYIEEKKDIDKKNKEYFDSLRSMGIIVYDGEGVEE